MNDATRPLPNDVPCLVRSQSEAELLPEMKKCFLYCPKTGEFTNIRGGNGKLKGSRMGTVTGRGYAQISFKRKSYAAHRIAWFLSYGSFPPDGFVIDHINGIRDDNRIENLRVVSQAENLQNTRRAISKNTTGLLGVSRDGKRFRAAIVAFGIKYNLGKFNSADEAHFAYVKAKRTLHRTCTI